MTGPDATDLLPRAIGGLTAARDRFLATLRPRLSRNALIFACAASVISFAAFALFTARGLQFGDAAMYAERIASLAPQEQPTHFGYFVMGIVFTRLLPVGPDYALNLMSALLGALCVGLVSSIAFTLTGRLAAGIGASCVLATMLLFALNATEAEVYVPQLFWFLLCVQCVLWNRPVASGLSFAAAMLVTPSTVFALPFLLLLRPKLRFVLTWTLIGVIVPLAVWVPQYKALLWGSVGPRGEAPGLLGAVGGHLSWPVSLSKEWTELRGFSVSLAFAVVGLAVIATSRRHVPLAIALLSLWFFPFLLAEKFSDVPVQMPLYGMVAVCAGVGFAWSLHAVRGRRPLGLLVVGALAAAVVIAGVPTWTQVAGTRNSMNVFRQEILTLPAEPGDIAIGPTWVTGLVTHYLAGKSVPAVVANVAIAGRLGPEAQNRAMKQLTDAVAKGRTVWLLERSTWQQPVVEKYFADSGYRIQQQGLIYAATPVPRP